MLLKRYGTTLRSVTPEFKAEALNEIGFRRDQTFSIATDEFDEQYERTSEVALRDETDAAVQKDAEEALLERLLEKLDEARDALDEGAVLVIENDPGDDWPKTRERRKDVIVDGKNRFHFHWRVDPPLRLGVYRRRE